MDVMKGKERKLIGIIGVLLFLAGAGIFLYPKFTAYQYTQEVAGEKQAFLEQIQEAQETSQSQGEEKEEDSLLEELYQELLRRNEELFQESQKDLCDPFSYEQPTIDLTQYGLSDNIIGFISIEKMGIELPIYLGANQQNMSLGAAHLTETSYPIGGENTNCVLAAHRGYARAPMFREIEVLEPGDLVTIQNFRETLYYEVEETKVILPTEVDQLLIQPGKDMLTLITCHPYPTNTYRYVVYCTRVEAPAEES